MECLSCNFDNPPGMRFCGRCGAPLEGVEQAPAPPVDDAEHRQLTVLFCDLVGSTALSERLDPEALRQVMLAYHDTVGAVIERFDGHRAQLLGDGVLAYFGYPQAREDDPRRAVHAGLGILEAMTRLSGEGAGAPGPRLAVRVAVHTGPVVAGELGSDRRQQLALGQTPDLAARLQALAAPGEIVVSGATHELVEGLFTTGSLGRRTLPGISKPVEVYRVLGESGVPERFQVVARDRLPPLVGRRRQLDRLRGWFLQPRQDRPRAMLLGGEAGFGKSRLVHELKLSLSETPHTWWSCFCSPHHRNSPLRPWIELLQELFELRRGAPQQRQLAKLEAGMAERGAALPEAVPLFAGLLSIPLPSTYEPSGSSPQRQKEQTLGLLRDLLLQQARQKPLLLLVENLHWADPSTLELLDLLIRDPAAPGLFVLITCRPSFEPPWTPGSDYSRTTLERLSEAEVEAVVNHWTGGRPLPHAVLEQVLHKTDGIPLFVEELTKTILESGLLVEGEAAYELAGPLPPLAIPSTLQDSLRARLDRLPPRVKEVAQVGSVVGRTFSRELLAMISPRAESTIDRSLAQLVDSDLIHPSEMPAASYRFKHAMIQEATYGSLLKRQRRLYHRRIAEALEGRFPAVGRAQPEILAHHFAQAGRAEQGVDYWLLAGQESFQRSAIREAVAHLEKGLALLESLPEGSGRQRRELPLQAALGGALSTVKGFAAPEVNRAYGRALEICRRLGDTPELFWILWGLWRFHFVRASLDQALELGRSLARLAEEPAARIAARFALGATLYCRGEIAAAHGVLEQGIHLDSSKRQRHYAAQTGEDSGVACLIWDAWCLWLMGHPERARRRGEDALALARRIAHPFSLTYALACCSFLSCFRRDPASVLEQTEEVLALSLERGFWFAVPAQVFLGWAHVQRGVPATLEEGEVTERIGAGIAGHLGSGARLHTTQLLSMAAEVATLQSRFDDAARGLDQALAAVESTGERFFEAEVHRLRGELELASGSEQRAESSFHSALAVARKQGSRSLELRAALSLSRLWARRGQSRQAGALLAPLHAGFTEGFDTADLRQAGALLDDLENLSPEEETCPEKQTVRS